MKKHECPNCKKMSMIITYDNPNMDYQDAYYCSSCGWSG